MLLKCNIKRRVERMMLFVELGSLLYTITLFPFYQVATGMNNFIQNKIQPRRNNYNQRLAWLFSAYCTLLLI